MALNCCPAGTKDAPKSKTTSQRPSAQKAVDPCEVSTRRGTKRTITGLFSSPLASEFNIPSHHQFPPLSPGSEDDWQESFWSCNEDVSSSDEDTSQELDDAYDHKLQAQRLQLQQLLIGRYKRWSAGVEYTVLPEDRIRPRKRFKASQAEPSFEQTEEGDDTGDEELVVVSHAAPQTEFYHLACPFYAHAPARHQRCLVKGDLLSPKEVMEHLLRDHDRSPYCPICHKTFESTMDRDNHVLDKKCNKLDRESLNGLSEDQKGSLILGDWDYTVEKETWFQIWAIVFPSVKHPCSPYLEEGCGLSVSMVYDFWVADGQNYVSTFLGKEEGFGNHRGRKNDIVSRQVLEDLVNCIIEKHNPSTTPSVDE